MGLLEDEMKFLVLSLFVVLSACSGVVPADRFQPKPVTTELPTLHWPPVIIEISDERPNNAVAHEDLVSAVEGTIRQALNQPSNPGNGWSLKVVILRHEAMFPGGGSPWWVGTTSFRAVLLTTDGKEYRWVVDDVNKEWNVWGYGSGTDAAQHSLREALRKLLRQMHADVRA